MSRGRLIIVDDEPVILRLLASVFEGEGYDLVTCADGRSAMEAIDAGVDVLLTDKNLPDVGGLELLEHAKQRQPDCEVLIITGYASLDTVLRAMHLDAFDYIVKPPKDIFHVKRKVGQAFAKVRLARENKELLARLKERNAELEAALEELKEVQAELIQSEKLAGIGTLAAGIAHEISSPLFGVMGLAEAIQEEEDRELVNGYAREIVDYSRTIKEIVVQLSGYSRTAELEYHTTVELSKVIADAVKLVRRSLGAEPMQVVLDVADDLHINARTNEIQQVFVNLVKNALEAIAERHGESDEGCLTVTAGRDARGTWIEVRDNGDGIPPDRVGAIFDPFYTTKPPGRGTGLGLNIVYRIVTKYRGTISVESIVGSGTQFTLRFPGDNGEADAGGY
ncbi:MAG: hybrid sensor histidine kinase/response regulator [Alphaproteobacteria bacterium]|nr:hybrid sensor histidine kinase/response regulator [Alphaproteobacteria bacterium]